MIVILIACTIKERMNEGEEGRNSFEGRKKGRDVGSENTPYIN